MIAVDRIAARARIHAKRVEPPLVLPKLRECDAWGSGPSLPRLRHSANTPAAAIGAVGGMSHATRNFVPSAAPGPSPSRSTVNRSASSCPPKTGYRFLAVRLAAFVLDGQTFETVDAARSALGDVVRASEMP